MPREAADRFNSAGSHLERYSKVLNACEINSSFYRSHKHATWERWASSVPAGFRFSVKAPKTITHESKLNCTPEPLSAFLQQVRLLHDKAGPVLMQLPPSLKFEYAHARKFLSLLRESYLGDVVWEPRHDSWFSDEAGELLVEFQIARVAADPACVPAAACPAGLTSLVYFRLHGSPRRYYSAYSDEFLTALADRLGQLATRARIWCIFDNTASGHAMRNALELTTKLKRIWTRGRARNSKISSRLPK
ncbi:MAG: DUF72 domain-containing protein [Candidatus Sulfotelmatobacter sp.]